MASNELDISPDRILATIVQQLGSRFFEATKTEAKQVYNQLNSGKNIPLLKISSPDRGDVVGVLKLDSSEFVGKLNFSAFRNALASHLARASEKLDAGENLNIFTSEETNAILFHIPGLVKTGDQFNILVTGVQQSKAGEIDVKLMFLNPANYETPPDTAESAGLPKRNPA